MLKNPSFYIAILSIVFCLNVSVQAQQIFIANLSGLQEVPANNSGGKGVCKISFHPVNNPPGNFQMNFQCNYANLTSPWTDFDIHRAPAGQNAAVLISFPGNAEPTSGTLSKFFIITPQIVADMLANRLYFNVKTQNFPTGEIRGQIHLANGTYNDFDGDGQTDITVYRSSNRTFYAQSSLTGELIQQAIGQAGDSVSLTVDFDGDGKSDFSTARYAAPIIWRIVPSMSNTVRETVWGSSASFDFFAAADYDGDGAFDIAVLRAGVWHIIESSTGNYRYEYFGGSGDAPAPNDYDRDGRADLAVARSENGRRVWYVRRSSDNQSYAVNWGLSSDAFFTGRADWDGDGAADITVIRNETGQRVFYILRSSDSQLQVIRWGASSDLVKLGDYDGDGKTDAAVTRTVDGVKVFFILQSSNNQPRYEYFGLPGDF